MIEAIIKKKPNWLQQYCTNLCIERFGIIEDIIFLRCMACNQIVPADDIIQRGQCNCGGKRYKNTNLTLKEEIYWVGRALLWKIRQK